MSWLLAPAAPINEEAIVQARAHQLNLTKPPGALGQLEDIAVIFAGYQGQVKPQLENIFISIFAGDHGIANKGVSAFPQAVTAEMIKNFANGGAAISVLARQLNAHFEVVNLGAAFDVPKHSTIIDAVIAKGTQDFTEQPAMSHEQLHQALEQGQLAALRAVDGKAQLFVGGEMGIANTSSATALASAYLQLDAASLVGSGTGINAQQVAMKAQLINQAVQLHEVCEPLAILQTFAGFEIVGLVGAYIQCAQKGIPVLVDGFITTAAALLAVAINPSIRPWLMFSHESAEPGHQAMLSALNAKPLLNIGMRLGEGSGAALVVALLQSAVQLHYEMATFSQAGVSEKA